MAKMAETIAIAARIPSARVGTVEIRPVIEVAGLPENFSRGSRDKGVGSREPMPKDMGLE
ncbi:hypothetical protein [Nostoc sp.]|uniref:hypothetical protein n=1 Tax=Nostoc sp. TaxID=1180 RepID=UPI002FF5E44E